MSDLDTTFMQTALELAYEVKGKTFPNPAVGAVVVNNGRIVGKGATSEWGGPHAEKHAICDAGENAMNATLYVTLEPCCHYGKTPPCTDTIIASGIKEVFVALIDPNPVVNGNGIILLQKSGIKVHVGLLRDKAILINEDFLWSMEKKSAWVTLKLAQTLDGKIADNQGNSKWITGEDSRLYVHELRRKHAAIAVGRSTLECDNPQLTVRHRDGYNPARIVFSNDVNLSKNSFFMENAKKTRTVVVVRDRTPGIIENCDNAIEYWYIGNDKTSKSMKMFLEMAYTHNLSSIFIEGGQRVASEFLEAGLVNRLFLFFGNRLLGGGKNGIQFKESLSMIGAITLEDIQFKIFEKDFMVSGKPVYRPT